MALHLKPIIEIKKDLGIQEGGSAHAFFTATCAKHMDKYVPFDKGILADYQTTVDEIRYETPYATYQYYGMRKDGSHVINSANRKRHMHPLATSYWDKKMVSAEMNEVEKEVAEYINIHGGGK